MPTGVYTRTPRPIGDRFWEKVDVRGPTECWLWKAGTSTAGGYGKINGGSRRGGRIVRAHRLSWALVNGPIPEGLFVCHHCDTPACVNPSHLFLGTPADNSADMSAKCRGPMGGAKLRATQVEWVRAEYAAGRRQQQIASELGVGQPAISRIVTGDTWRQ